ncbi:AsmA family protein [Nemorincola caseinilytica]
MRWVKLVLKVVGSLVALMLILFVCIAIYVQRNKERVFGYVLEQLKDNINGELHIGQMEPHILRSFPHVTVELEDVSLRDSLWQTHKRDLLRAKNIFVAVDLRSLLSGKPRIRHVNVENGRVHLYTDSTGYGNASIFRKKEKKKDGEQKELPRLGQIELTNVELLIENKVKFKDFHFVIHKAASELEYRPTGWDARIHLSVHVKNMMFNTNRGSFLKDKRLKTHLTASYDNRTETVTVPMRPFMLDDDKVEIGSTIVVKESPATFIIDIKANGIMYKNALSFLTPPIVNRLDKYDLKKKIDVQAVLKGHAKYRDTPYVTVTWQVKDNTFMTGDVAIEHCTFTGIYNNERVKDGGYKDDNAIIELKGLTGQWHGIPFRADTISISNIMRPVLQGRFRSTFDMKQANALTGGSSFRFDKGKAEVNILYKGGVYRSDTTRPYMYGTIKVSDAGMTYVPRGLIFSNSGATLRFGGSDLFIDDARLQRGNTVLNMQGRLLNFLNLYYTDPRKIIWDWQLQSPQIDLNEFVPLLAARKAVQVGTNTTGTARLSDQLDRFLDASSVRMNVRVDKLTYRHFTAKQLRGDVEMIGADIALKNVSVEHANGKLKVNVHVKQEADRISYTLNTTVEHVDVRQFFTAFENFGQSSITDRNIGGKLSTDIEVSGALRPNGEPVPYSINGTAAFRLEGGTLIGFAPLKAISTFVFRNRNLDSIAFRDIDNRFTIQGDKITIHPMFIESNAINMHVKGTYAIGKTGTDILMDIPLRNPKKDELVVDDELRQERSMQGIVLHLRAVDGPDGKVKIKWASKEDRKEKSDRPVKKRSLFGGR